MILFDKLLKKYSRATLSGSLSFSKKLDEVWPTVTKKMVGMNVGRPTNLKKGTVFVECGSSEEMAHVKMFEKMIVSELQKDVTPEIQRISVSLKKNYERTQ